MMKLTKWDPFDLRPFWNWPQVIDDDEVIDNRGLDIYETKDKVVVKASVAGVKPEEVDVTFEKGMLWIKAQAEDEEKEGKKYYKKSSRSYSYRVAVPGNIDAKFDPDAEIEHGVVSITFKKTPQTKPRKIAIKTKGK